MKSKSFLLLTLFFFSLKEGFGQNCNCENIANLVFKNIETNYIDNLYVLSNNKYKKFKSRTKKIVGKIFDKNECLKQLSQISEVLNDKHIVFYLNHSLNKIWKPEKHFTQKTTSFDFDPIMGHWISHNGNKLYITKIKPNCYIAILSDSINNIWSKDSRIATIHKKRKNTFLIDFISLGRLESIRKAVYDKNAKLLNFGAFKWTKITEEKSNNHLVVKPKISLDTDSSSYILLTINSFSGTKNLIDSVINSNKSLLQQIPHLIIDVSENQGGTVSSFSNIIPYLYTNKIYLDGSIWNCSKDNIENLVTILNRERKKDSILANKTELFIAKMKEQENRFLELEKDSIVLDSINLYPQKISLVIGKSTASAAELFILRAIQSKKVRTYGESTFGACDNLDATSFELGDNFFINLPISKRKLDIYKKRIDNIGIQPQIKNKNKVELINMLKKRKLINE